MTDTDLGTAKRGVKLVTFLILAGVVLIAVVIALWALVIALWEPLIIQPLVNLLVFIYRLTGNLGVSVLILSAGISVWHPLLRAPKLRAQQRMLEIGPGGEAVPQGYPVDFSKLLSGCLPGLLASGVSLVVYVGLIWVFWNVFLPESELSRNLHRFLWTPLDPLAESFDTHFAYLDLRDRDLAQVLWLPFPLPGAFVLASTALLFLNVYIRDVIKEKHWPALRFKWLSLSILCAVPLLSLVFGLIFPSGVILYGIVAQCLFLIELWLFPLAVVSD